MARIRDALGLVGVTVGGDGDLSVVVDPAAWYAGAKRAPSADRLGRTVGYSLAAYGSARMQDDAEVGRSLRAIAHPDARCAAHLARLGCRAVHVPLGCRPEPVTSAAERPVRVMTFGAETPRRMRAIARGAGALDDLRAAHLVFDGAAGHSPFGPEPLTTAVVLADVAEDDDAAIDPTVLLAAAEAGAAVVSERLGPWPDALTETVARIAPVETLFRHARELSADPAAAADAAATAHAALIAATPLAAMGQALAELLEAPAPITAPTRGVTLSPFAAPRTAPTVVETLRADAERQDAAVRSGLQRTLAAVKAVDDRVARLERGDDDGTVSVPLLASGTGPRPLVSVVIPAYGASRTLPETLESVRATAAEPDAPALEIIVVDDASPQPDAEVAAEWAEQHTGLSVTILAHGRNRGLSASRNAGIERAAGEFVLTLDADDLLRPYGLARLLRALQADPDAAFAYGILERFDLTGPTGLVGLHPWAPERMRTGNYIPALALLRRDVLTELGGYAEMPWGYEDWDLWCRVAEAGRHGTWVPEIVASYRTRPDSMSAGLHLSHVGPLADMLERHPALLT